MNWNYDKEKFEWNLVVDSEQLIKIKICNKPSNKINKFILKIYFSTYIISKKYQNKIKAKNISWIKKYIKKFKTIQETETYIESKKKFFEKYIGSIF